MSHRQFIAAPGVIIRDPRSKTRVPHVAPGAFVEVGDHVSFWARRVAEGSVTEVTSTPEPAPALAKRKPAASED